MQLSCPTSHRSMLPFSDLKLPDFTLITGLNGAGKSQLLAAIKDGQAHIKVNDQLVPQQRILWRDWSNLTPSEIGQSSGDEVDKREEHWRFYQRKLDEYHQWTSRQRSHPDPAQFLSVMGQSGRNDGSPAIIEYVARFTGKSALDLGYDDFTTALFRRHQGDLFQQSFAQLFAFYRRLQQQNHMLRGMGDDNALSEEDFERKYGQPPWNLINDILRASNLDFAMEPPDPKSMAPIAPRMQMKSGIPVSFNHMSSGERILMSCTLAVYNTNFADAATPYDHQPSVILFDEVDAPLHPSMSQSLLNVIQDILIEKVGLKVIATTHSPSTVALAPEESIYLMIKGQPGLQKVTKAAALNALTFGVPTMAINYEGRRQVFAESDADAKTYSQIYEILRPCLPTGRSLEFIGTGKTEGCAQVYKLVNALSKSGNQSVFGIVDSDGGKNKPKDRIVALSGGHRDGLENVLLDPLLLAALICHSYPKHLEKIKLPRTFRFIELVRTDLATLQAVVDNVVAAIFPDLRDEEQKTMCSYLGGFNLDICNRCLTMDDHTYEAAVKKAFPSLEEWDRAGELLQRVVFVLREHIEFCPADLVDTLKELLEKPAHV